MLRQGRDPVFRGQGRVRRGACGRGFDPHRLGVQDDWEIRGRPAVLVGLGVSECFVCCAAMTVEMMFFGGVHVVADNGYSAREEC